MPYSDLPLNLKKNNDTRDIELRTEERSIQGAVSNIIMTARGEIFYRPNFGCSVKRFLFEKLNPFIFLIIRDEIRYALYRNEPRIDNIQVEVIQGNNSNGIEVSLEYRIKSLNITSQQTLSLGIN